MSNLLEWAIRWSANRRRRHQPGRRAVGRVVAVALAPLEVRNLLSNVPLFVGPTAPLAVASLMLPPRPLPWATPVISLASMPPPTIGKTASVHDPLALDPRLLRLEPRLAGPTTYLHPPEIEALPELSMAGATGLPTRSVDGDRNNDNPGGRAGPGISEVEWDVDGKPVPEVAVSNEQTGTVTVFAGPSVVFQVGGLNHPEGVKLADLTNDGTPDLVIADSGENKVLVYAGLTGGGFGPEVTGGHGFAVGTDPVGLSVGDIDRDGLADLIVANKGSNTVSILRGRTTGSAWTLDLRSTVQTGTAPVRALLVPTEHDPNSTSLLICNSGSDDVYWYKTTPGGEVEAAPSRIIPVGPMPDELFVGHFSPHADADMVTVNPGSDSLTFISGVFSPDPIRQDVTSPGWHPLAAIPLTVDSSGVSDLMVANSDGRISFLQAGDNGLQLTGLIASPGLSNVTSIAVGQWTTSGLAIYEASSDSDSIALLRFNFGDVTLADDAVMLTTTVPASTTSPASGTPAVVEDEATSVEIVPIAGSSMDLVGVLWSRSGQAQSADTPDQGRTAKGSLPAVQAAAMHHDDLDFDAVVTSGPASAADELPLDDPSTRWTRFVLGIDAALESFGGEVAAVAAADPQDQDDWPIDWQDSRHLVAQGTRRDGWTDEAAPASTVVEPPGWQAIPLGLEPGTRANRLLPAVDQASLSSEAPQITTAAVGSAVAVRLLVKTSPPRPSRHQPARRTNTRPGASPIKPWPEVLPRAVVGS